MNVEYYRVDARLQPRLQDLERRLSDDVRAVLAVNYFGFPLQDIDTVRSCCAEHGALLIEDNAHSPLSMAGDQLLGTRGDIGVIGLRKEYPVGTGAILTSSSVQLDALIEPRQHVVGREDFYSIADLLLSQIERWFPGYGARIRTSFSPDTTSAPPSHSAPSAVSQFLLRHLSAAPDMLRRQQAFKDWMDRLPDSVEPVFTDLPAGTCPARFPVTTEQPARTVEAFKSRGVNGVFSWPPGRLPAPVQQHGAYETARQLETQLLLLPVAASPARLDERSDR